MSLDNPGVHTNADFGGAVRPAPQRIIPERNVGQKHSFLGNVNVDDPVKLAAENTAYTTGLQARMALTRR